MALIDGRYAATLRYRDLPRAGGNEFIRHLKPRHGFERILLVSGDRESEARYLAEKIGISEVYAGQSPEQKLALVREETRKAPTVFLGDGINDAPALTAATVGIAFGQSSDVTAEAAGAVVLESSLERVNDLLHIGRRMRAIALQTAIGGMSLSLIGMLVAAVGYLPPVAGAIAQEVIDVLAVLNALRASVAPRDLRDWYVLSRPLRAASLHARPAWLKRRGAGRAALHFSAVEDGLRGFRSDDIEEHNRPQRQEKCERQRHESEEGGQGRVG